MSQEHFDTYFSGPSIHGLVQSIRTALAEDGPDLTSIPLFSQDQTMRARIVAKQDGVIAGLPLVDLVLNECDPHGHWAIEYQIVDGDNVFSGQSVALLSGAPYTLLKAERIILNYLCHLSGIATLTSQYVEALGASRTRLLDTRKTLPGLRRLEKYAVRMGGGFNHRMDLAQMLMLKDTHIDQAGSITKAAEQLRKAYFPCPPLEVECRSLDEIREAVAIRADRVMLDNFSSSELQSALALIPNDIETEVSGGVSLDTIAAIGAAGPDYVSVGRITHSAPSCDFSMHTVTCADECAAC